MTPVTASPTVTGVKPEGMQVWTQKATEKISKKGGVKESETKKMDFLGKRALAAKALTLAKAQLGKASDSFSPKRKGSFKTTVAVKAEAVSSEDESFR